MKISRVKVYLLYSRFVYLKVETDEGICGWEEAIHHGGRITAQISRSLGDRIVGRDPFQIDAIWQELFQSGSCVGNTGAYVAALGALDIVLYDIKGRALGTPVWNLLGGKFRDQVEVYSSLMQRDLPPEKDVERVHSRMEQGYTWVKLLHTATAWGLDRGRETKL